MTPFANGVKYHIDQLLFMVVDNEMEGCISDYSESTTGLLRNYGIRLKSEYTAITKRIQDLVVDLDFAHVRNTREDRYLTKEIYEAVHVLDLASFKDTSVMRVG
jgi:hypothetical protein